MYSSIILMAILALMVAPTFISNNLGLDGSYDMKDMLNRLAMVLFSLYVFKDLPFKNMTFNKYCMWLIPVLLLVVSLVFAVNYFVVDVVDLTEALLIGG